MAKRKKRKSNDSGPQHRLPSGFWSQVGALILIAISILFIVAWFGAGGPILEWIHNATLSFIGYAVYTIPLLFIYIAVEIFRSENNQLPFITKFAAATIIMWFSALFGLLKDKNGQTDGGFVGDTINSGMLALVNSNVAAFIYLLLIFITLLFIMRVSPFSVIKKLWEIVRRDTAEYEANKSVMNNVAKLDAPKSSLGEIKINASVPVLDHNESNRGRTKLPSLNNPLREKITEEQNALVTISDPNWKPPSLDLLEKKQSPADAGDWRQNAEIIRNTLKEFDIEVEMEGANVGPRVTQYTLKPQSGVKLARITQLENNIALNLAAKSLRIEAPIPGQKAVGIEVPNRKAADVRLYSILTSNQWKVSREPLAFAIGKDISGEAMVGELNTMPHLLIAGQTGAGKSVMINTLLMSLLYHNSPSEMKLILVDPKQVEMTAYEDIPHLLTPIITEPDKTISALKWAVNEMQRRYALLADNKVKDIKTYNQKIRSTGMKITVNDERGIPQQHENGAMPYIVIVIDELAELMMIAARDVESLIVRLAQKARAVGIHLVLATQSPRVDVITGLIKANIPARIAFTVAQQVESRIILDQSGAEKLLNHGDMLLLTPTMSKPKRVQGALVIDEEIHKVTDYLRAQSPPQYNDEIISQPVQLNGKGGVVMDFDNDTGDSRYDDAVKLVVETGKASATYLQLHLRIGYARAARIIALMEDRGIIGPADGARPREVLVSSMDEIGQNNEES
ncbi:MAG: DNA translocase FtsK 4TM domain-containing protein [Candidatus Saccharimonadaceae bacterium]|nr:DNA translocase FtsK 4TM domain-containing protein [Candidatus Saccharimonadaceae bacterium]